MIKVGIIKCGNIAVSTVIDLMLDERANRANVEIRVLGTGAKMGEEEVEYLAQNVKQFDSDLIVYLSPNLTAPGPKKAIDLLSKLNKPVIMISDAPTKKVKELVPENVGFIIVPSDPMMGVRREFLDPIEMLYFNADALKVLAATGTARFIQEQMDGIIQAMENGEKYQLPRTVIKRDKAVAYAKYDNPYAKTKAMACFEMAVKVGEMTVEGCFMTKDKEKYIPIVSSAHELLRQAAVIADEAREIEKTNDMVVRFPHRKKGISLEKRKLMEKPPK